MHVRIGYPDQAAESEILRLARERARGALGEAAPAPEKLPMQDVFDARREVLDLHMAPALERYLIELVLASRDPSRYDAGLGRRIAWGQARVVPSHWNAAPVRAPGWPAATSSPPTTCGRRRRCAIACCPAMKPPPRAGTANAWCRSCWPGCRHLSLRMTDPSPEQAPSALEGDGLRPQLAELVALRRLAQRPPPPRRGRTGNAGRRRRRCVAAAWSTPSRASTWPATTRATSTGA
jgi:hypothetical protein